MRRLNLDNKLVSLLFGVIVPLVWLLLDVNIFKGEFWDGPIFGRWRVLGNLVIASNCAIYLCGWLNGRTPQRIHSSLAPLLAVTVPFMFVFCLIATPCIFFYLSAVHSGFPMILSLTAVLFQASLCITGIEYIRAIKRQFTTEYKTSSRLIKSLTRSAVILLMMLTVDHYCQSFVDHHVKIILKGERTSALASAHELQAAFWCDWSCAAPISDAYVYQRASLTPEQWEIVKECFKIATKGVDIERHWHPVGI